MGGGEATKETPGRARDAIETHFFIPRHPGAGSGTATTIGRPGTHKEI